MEQLYPIDDFFKQRISLHEFPPLPEAWADMEAKLSAIQLIPANNPSDFTLLDDFFKDKIAAEPLAFVPNAWAQLENMLGGLETEPANALDDFFKDKIAAEPLAFVPNAWAQMENMLGGLETEPANALDDFFKEKIAAESLALVPNAWAQMENMLGGLEMESANALDDFFKDKIAAEPLAFVPNAWAQMEAALEGIVPTTSGEELLRERLNTESLDFVPNAWAQMEALMDNTVPEPAHFDDGFRYRLQSFEPDFIPAAWVDMDAKLEAETHQKRRYAGWWFWSSVCLATIASVLGVGIGNYSAPATPTLPSVRINTANANQNLPIQTNTTTTNAPLSNHTTNEKTPSNQALANNNPTQIQQPNQSANLPNTLTLQPTNNQTKVSKSPESGTGQILEVRNTNKNNTVPSSKSGTSNPKKAIPAQPNLPTPTQSVQDTPRLGFPIAQNAPDTAAIIAPNPIANQDPHNPNSVVASLSQNFLEISPLNPNFLPVEVENLTEKPLENKTIAALDLKAPKIQKWSVSAWLGVSNRISKTLNQPAFSASPMFGAGLTYKIQDRQSVQFGLQYKPIYMNVEDAFFGFVPGEEPKAERDSALASGVDMLTQFINAKMRVFHLHRLDVLELPIAYKYQISKRHSFSFVLKTSCVFSANVREFGADTSTRMSRSAIGINYVDISTGLGYEFRLNKHLSLLAQFHMGLMNLTYKAQTKYRNYVTYSSVPASEGNIYLKLPEEAPQFGNTNVQPQPAQARILELPEKLKNSDFQIALRYTF